MKNHIRTEWKIASGCSLTHASYPVCVFVLEKYDDIGIGKMFASFHRKKIVLSLQNEVKDKQKKNNTIDAHVDRVLVSNGAIVGKIASARYLITGATVEVERVCSIVILSAVRLLSVDTVNMHFDIKKGTSRI